MSKKLLLADDSVVIQKLVGLSFANEDIEIFSTDNGDDAVTQAREIRPDVILADVVMPGLSGYEVCESIKQDPELAHTPVLLLTGTFEAFDEARADSAGANGQITKPFEAQALVERVTEVMNAPPPAPVAAAAPAATATSASTPELPPAAQETMVSPLPPSSSQGSDDLFDANVSSLSGTDADDASLDLTPNLPPEPGFAESSAPARSNASIGAGLFGAPGDGANDELEHHVGDMALGQAVARPTEPTANTEKTGPASSSPDDDATIVNLPPAAKPIAPLEPPRAASPADTHGGSGSSGTSGTSSTSDPLAAPPPLPKARPVDLDAPLGGLPSESEATILVAQDDVNAATSPNLGAPIPADAPEDSWQASPPSPPAEFDDLTVHVPSADIDHDTAAAPTPSAVGSDAAPGDATVVADLDASLGASSDAAIRPSTPTGASPAAPEAGASAGPLDFRPSNVGADDLDFAFDVSEQVATENARDALDDSYSSLMDISESQILGAPPEEPTPEPAETIVAGYDVSSSDLATAETPVEESSASEAIPAPEPERLDELPKLPKARTPQPEPAPITGDADLFDGLATGSPLDEIEAPTDFAATADLEAEADLIDAGLPSSAAGSVEIGEAVAVDDARIESGTPIAFGTSVPDEEAVPETDLDEELLVGIPPASTEESSFEADGPAAAEMPIVQSGVADEDRRIPDLSPMMEQHIHETLEKVAWEAFSDLSESIVKQVMTRIEQIAWEVIPEMAETLVREEIRKMKGEDD